MSISGDYLCKLSLPNKEIVLVYCKEIIQRISSVISQDVTVGIQGVIMLKDIARL